MSLDLSVVLKDRLTKERLASLHAFLTRKRFIKEKLRSSSFFYLSIEPNISIDVFLIEAPMKRDNFWKDLHANVKRVAFPPKSAICMESRHTEASHLNRYSLGKALARRFGGIVFDHLAQRLEKSLSPKPRCPKTTGKVFQPHFQPMRQILK